MLLVAFFVCFAEGNVLSCLDESRRFGVTSGEDYLFRRLMSTRIYFVWPKKRGTIYLCLDFVSFWVCTEVA